RHFFYFRTCKPRRLHRSHVISMIEHDNPYTHSSRSQCTTITLSAVFPMWPPSCISARLLLIRFIHTPRQQLRRNRKRGAAVHSRVHESVRCLNGYGYRRMNMLSDRILAPKAELLIPILCQRSDERHCVRRYPRRFPPRRATAWHRGARRRRRTCHASYAACSVPHLLERVRNRTRRSELRHSGRQ